MGASSLDMSLVRELHIVLIEVDMPLLAHARDDLIFIDPSEDLPIFAFQSISECLPIEEFLYFISLLELLSGLVFSLLFFLLDLLESLRCDLSCESLWDEHIPCLCARYIDDLSLATEVRDIGEELYSEKWSRHISTI